MYTKAEQERIIVFQKIEIRNLKQQIKRLEAKKCWLCKIMGWFK